MENPIPKIKPRLPIKQLKLVFPSIPIHFAAIKCIFTNCVFNYLCIANLPAVSRLFFYQ